MHENSKKWDTLRRYHVEKYSYFLIVGARGRNRTTDTRIFNPLLYP